MNPPRRLRLGDPVNGTIGKSLGGRRFVVESREVPRGWKVELHTRQAEAIEVGMHTTFWVSRVVPVKSMVVVRDGDHGRLPVSAAMQIRYVAALQAILGEVELDGDRLADLRGMVTRIDTQDAADWLTVWRLLGEAETGDLKELGNALAALREARKTAPDEVEQIRAALLEVWETRFRDALEHLA